MACDVAAVCDRRPSAAVVLLLLAAAAATRTTNAAALPLIELAQTIYARPRAAAEWTDKATSN